MWKTFTRDFLEVIDHEYKVEIQAFRYAICGSDMAAITLKNDFE